MNFFLIFLLFSSTSAFQLNCIFNVPVFWSILDQLYTGICWINAPIIGDRVTGYNGTHFDGRTSLDVEGLILTDDNRGFFKTIPQGLLEFFPNFRALQIVGCPAITELSGNELIEYLELELFNLGETNIDRVPGNIFQPTPNLRQAGFSNNPITRVGSGLLDNLMRLEVVYFEKNICINQNAMSPSEIPALIEALRINCGDF